MKTKWKVVCLLAIVTAISVAASSMTCDAAKISDYQTAILYNSANGLLTSEANATAQTSDGFLWIGSYSGLTRYDGTSFDSYDSVDGVPGVVSLYVDTKDRLWIGTNDNGIAMFEDEQFTSFADSEALSSHSIRAITEDGNGNIIVGTTMGVGYVNEKNELHALNEPQLNGEYVDNLVRDENGVVYGRTLTGSIFTIENLRVRNFYEADKTDYGETICIVPDPGNPGYVYIGTGEPSVVHASMAKGLKTKEVYATGEMSGLNDLLPIGDEIYICSDEGIGLIDKHGKFHVLSDLPMDNSVDSVMQDSEGNLWFTSSRQGIMKIVPNDFVDVTGDAGISGVIVNSTCVSKGLLYVGCDNGLIILDKKTNKRVENELTSMLADIRIRSIRKIDDGTLLFATYSDNGLVILSPDGQISTCSMANGLPSDRVRTTLQLENGDIAVATSGGVSIIEDGEVSRVLNAETGVKNSEILCIAEKSDGTLLMGSDGDGIYAYADGNVTRFGRGDGLSSEVVMRMVADPAEEDAFWIVTSNRIDYLDSKGRISTVEKFPYADNFDIYFDDMGNAWILSGVGIYVVDRDNLFDDEELDVSFFDSTSGLPASATVNAYSCIDDDGTFYIAGASGVIGVQMDEIRDKTDILQLALPYVEADDAMYPIAEDGTVTIPASTKRLTIYGHAITYSLKNPKVQYQLEGFDDEAQVISRRDLAPITYTNLNGGTYAFKLSSLMPTTGEVANTISVTINKTKHFYEHLIVRLMGAGFLAAIVGLCVWYYFRRKTMVLEERQKRQRAFINQTINAFAKAIDFKDRYTNGHSFRVANYTKKIATRMGFDESRIEEIYNIALLHDIGKIAIPDEILNKPSGLNDEEYEVMKSHAKIGGEILQEISSEPDLALGAAYHHERVDGKGYPNGLAGDDIPEVAQIIAVADTFDAMYSTRPYRKKLALSTVLDEIRRIAGTQLNPKIVDVFISLCDDGEVQ